MSDSTDPNIPPSPELDSLRERIDELDASLLKVLSERAQIVVEIGRLKRSDGTPIYAPHRERQVIKQAIERNTGPLPARSVEAIFRELMSGSFALELPLRVGYLGPAGSFSHLAAARQFGASVEFDDLHTIEGVFEEVAAGRVHYGLVPYENSISGSITDTLDAFSQWTVTAYSEVLIEVAQHFLANCPPNTVTKIYSKPQIFDQCRRWIAKQFPEAQLIPTSSSAAAVKRAAAEANAAAIGSVLAGEIYGVNVIFEKIQDKPDNITRFLVIARETAKPTGDDKTSIMFTTEHKPGALVDVLNVFRDARINLSHIDKRPSHRTNWEYTFFIDCEGHIDDPKMAAAIEAARTHCGSLMILGSYPKATQIL